MKPEVILRAWQIFDDRLNGIVFNHPRFEDGTFVTTSTVIYMDADTAETLNTIYTLEK